MSVNAEGEPTGELAKVSRDALEELVNEAATTISRLQGEASALVNALTAVVIRTGVGSDVGIHEVQLTPADMDRIGGHVFTMSQDPATKAVILRARRKSAAASALTAAQELDNRRAGEVALPKSGIVVTPSRLILP